MQRDEQSGRFVRRQSQQRNRRARNQFSGSGGGGGGGYRRRATVPTALGLLAGSGIGAAAMWLMDPARGRGRRAWLGQKATRLLNETGDFMRATGRHLANKSKGYYYETRSAAECAMQGITSAAGEAGQQQPEQSTANLSA